MAHPNKTAREEIQKNNTVSEVEYRHDNSAASLSVHALSNQSYIIQYIEKKHPFTSHLAAKHPKHSIIAITDM